MAMQKDEENEHATALVEKEKYLRNKLADQKHLGVSIKHNVKNGY
jgi:hypothetical protein